MGYLGNEVYGFSRDFVQFLFLEEPRVSAGSALKRCLGFGYVEFGVLELGWLKLLKRE
jgi:hypothetical protein